MTEGAKVSVYVWSVAAGDWVPLQVAAAGLMPVTVNNWPADPATGGRQDVQTDVMSLIRILLNARLPSVLDTDALKVREQNWPATYPLSAAQIAALQAVNVGNFPADYPLPAAQVATLQQVTEQSWPADYPLPAADIASLRSETFGGNVYSKTMTMTDDNATRFEAAEKKLRDIIIIVTVHPMLLGETGVVVYPVGVGETIGFTKVDISTLYFQNANAGDDATITILGVEE